VKKKKAVVGQTREARMKARFLEERKGVKAKAKAAKAAAVKGPESTVNFNFMIQAAKQKAIPKAVTSMFLGEKGGAVVLGGMDSKYHIGKVKYHKALTGVAGNWVLKIDSMVVNGHEVCKNAKKKGCLALMDSGTTAMMVPERSALKITGATPTSFAATMAQQKNTCKHAAKFVISGKEYHLGHLAWCGRVNPMGDRIESQLQGLADDSSLNKYTWIILGEAFLKGFYTVYDNSNHKAPKIGLAPVCKQSQVMCLGKARLCKQDLNTRVACPITCGLCGVDKNVQLDEMQFEP
jgi:hypothetical protein